MKSNELLAAFIEQSRLIADIARQFVGTQTQPNPLVPVVERLQAQLEASQATLDKIVTAKYDRPIGPQIPETPAQPMFPGFALHDQADIDSPTEAEIAAGLAALNVDSDEEFLKVAANG